MIVFDFATMDDWARLYAWRNDPVTRATSISTDPVGLDEHLKWLKTVLERPTVHLFIARDPMAAVPKVGTCRIEELKNKTVEVSLTVAPSHRGFGYAAQIVARVTEEARRLYPGQPIRAVVKQDNYPSLRAFASCGYTVKKIKDDLVELMV